MCYCFRCRSIQRTVGGIPRPLIDLSAHNFAKVMDEAFGYKLDPPFDPYTNSLNFLLASYVIPYLGLNGYVGTNPIIDGYETKKVTISRTHSMIHTYYICVFSFPERTSTRQ